MRQFSGKALLASAIILGACGAPQPAAPPAPPAPTELPAASPDAIRADMDFLASDDLEGREAGTPGFDLAADYVAAEFAEIGLAPGGDAGTYFQTISFLRSVRAPEGRLMEVTNTETGAAVPFTENVDYAMGNSLSAPNVDVTGEAVFVGFGIVAPDLGRDDFEGLDLSGKVAVMLAGTPKGIQTEERAYYGTRKYANASDRGAIAVVSLETPTSRGVYPFERLIREGRLDGASLTWLGPDGAPFSRAPNVQSGASVPMESAAKLFEGTEGNWTDIVAAAEAEGGNVKGFALPYTIHLTQASTHDQVQSANVIGMIEGTDPVLKNEVIVLTAHLDHIGITKSIEGDQINNGALDNASGIATLLEAARMLKAGPPMKRSVMFIALTAEEKGLLGAQYFAENPTVPKENLVANVNLDMPILTYPFTDLVVFGGSRSTIIEEVEKAAAEMDITLSPDPVPDQGLFTRSDHFRFVEAGIPSVYLIPGWENGGAEEFARHMTSNYHRPSDDMTNSIDFDAAARFAAIKARIALALANADERPLWRKDDFFARQFDGPMEP
ncbi:peptidase, M20/M25/M40 family [Hyphomonas neptunium ATCC 15444]|uniref:Peptidase, M20/M25/M40 family n=2 Tax=Hyphomonas TaxID=85 RepID=Q0BZU1_HYPNA|nr:MULTISPECIES: M28 family metallopeptidase [Hyphomonas]ABI76318.1 peptidase, M20/M25/M40 family [Hyphomonas neptunium ATCC 15444]KCZ87885.1 M20/M25/M40 family peptidase [Hyphomonas hirschiana VP5]